MSGGGLQPHRRGGPLRMPGQQLDAMLRGADLHGQNPADLQRQQQSLPTQTGMHMRRARQSRPSRPSRPSR